MSWTITLKDAFDGNPRTQRARTYLSLYLLLSLFFLSVQPDFVFSKDQQFSWKTGQWSQCIGEKCGSGGVQTRTIWCVHTEGWTTHYTHCQHMDKPESQRDCFKVCDWHQNLFEWEVLDWGHCVLAPLFFKELKLRNTECITAQHGIQKRKVHCVRTSNHTTVTARICEFFSPKPPAEQACLIPCPQDCVVSDFTSWSSCSKTCGVGLQHRTRHVLATPIYGGESCPNLTETRPCSNPLGCPTGESKYHFSLKAGAWSECRLLPLKDTFLRGRTTMDFNTSFDENKTVTMHKQLSHHHSHQHQHQSLVHRNPLLWELEVGYRIRQVRCIRSDGKNSMQSLCIKDNSPLTFQLCVMPKDCQTSDWSLWSPCSKTCRSTDLSPGYRLRSRIMTHIPVGGGKQCPALKEKEACNIIGDLLPICPRFVWRTTDWGECHVLPLLSQQDQRLGNISNLCGGGIRSRRPYCVQVSDDSALHDGKEVSRPVDASLCASEEPPSSVQHCYISCQHHCLLSHWSPWGACIHDNCREPQGKKGFRKRTREVLLKSGSPRQACPHLVEFIPCEDPACYLWQVQQEGGCILNKTTCGPGTVARKVTCISTEGKDVQNAHCLDDPPPTEVACEVVCPDDCVVGPWSLWSPCSHSCASKLTEGQQSRTRSMLAIPGKEGRNCPAAPALEEWRVCNDHPCIVFYWDASPWGPCIEDASMNISGLNLWNETPSCGVGVQIRRVSCMKMNFGPVQNKRCSESTRPESIQPCSLACKKDCIVTPFSEWSACPTSCIPDNTTQTTQSRYRIIIQRPSGGGQECPDTLYEERECESLPVCPVYRWKPHQWHSCKVVPDSVHRGLPGHGEACGNGLETRGLSCVKESDEPASMTECLRWAGPLPPQIRPCWVACKDDCTFTAWSEFSECSGCGSSHSRKRSLTGPSKKREHCLNEELYPLEDTETCPCQKFLSLPFGNWSACILPDPSAPGQQGWMNDRERKECGPGLRYRAVACIDQKGHLANPTLCTDSGFMVESCHIPCPLDCKLSEWSPWSACSASCGSGLKIRSKWLREKAFNGGRPCPRLDLKNQAQVNEAVTCHSECSQYEWRIEPWSICAVSTVDGLPGCGEGVQSRKVRCVKKGTGSEARHVEDSLCDYEETPPRVQVCFLACPGDCVVTSWGPWSNCPLHCDQGTTRHRTRDILRLPASENSSCPDLVQSEPCVLNSTCLTYQYRVSDWSTCHLSEQAICGLGIRIRLLDCIRSDGKTVESQWCEQLGLINKWRLFESCMVDCPVSCILSDWSPWAECSHTCGSKGQAVRTRRILQESHEEGRPCPTQLVQTKPCPIKPCYTWLLSDWSPCIVEGARCGEGLRRRNLTCIVHWGDWPESSAEPVDEELCGDKLRQELQQDMEQSCFVPCPGDCHLTVWSPWSSCQLTCLEGRSFETTGHQARSRAVIIQVTENQESCPHQVFETRHCKGGKCHSYQWRTGGWSNNKREVWCQRSDGVNVTGGCFQQKKPATVRHCHPPCTKPFSFCTPNGVCGCEKGYTEVMTTHGFLDYCTRTPGVENNKKADVKTNSGRLKPGPSQAQDLYREWTLRPVGQDGRVKLWVYAVTAVGFILILFIIALSFLVCSPSKTTKTSPQPQKPLTLAYDGDMDM
ncbi:thrombospondin type-1 domain-containing protein 7B [Cheilinus undulatus]|uniref:thrombospondin type-1 domain-containing protein 7B n=1 Tax=Cheilinus undulatus TaxID=241271 RepID=UPI001BD1FDE6|nr:thrombospondin type-1 domain-containing protein 7B [Cheilinus undulatus]